MSFGMAFTYLQHIKLYYIVNTFVFTLITKTTFIFQGEFAVKLEIANISQHDRGLYKLVAKNEKGEASSQQVEITEIPEDKGDKPQIIKHFRSLVIIFVTVGGLERMA